MRNYWLRIALGAFGVFAIGMLIWNMVDAGKRHVKHVVESADPITIPLALIPFKVDGQSLGTLRQVQIVRSDPKQVEAVNFRVRLADSVGDARLDNCVLVVGGSLKNIDAQHAFSCVPTGDTVGGDLAPVGDVKTQRGRTYVLFAKAVALDSIQIDFDGEAMADSIAEAHQRFADSIGAVEEQRADSIQSAAELMADSIRSHVDSVIRASRPAVEQGIEQARKARTRASATVTVEPPPPPAVPKR
jgi:hypothetical protein